MHEHGSDCQPEFTNVGGAPGTPGVRTRRQGVRGAASDPPSCAPPAVKPAGVCWRAGDGGLDGGEDLELLVQAGEGQDPGHCGRGGGQVQVSAEQRGAPRGAYEDGEAAGVGVAHR